LPPQMIRFGQVRSGGMQRQGRELLLMTGFTRAERAEALGDLLDALIDSLDFSPGRRDRP
ncbi:MAG: hypothetical protein ACLFU2_12830, partial [Opitutales bacterium]